MHFRIDAGGGEIPCHGDFQERCHSWAAVYAACINGSFCSRSCSSGG